MPAGHIPPLKLYNTLSRQKEEFQALNPPFVGMYVCGPTVYNTPHIGNARPAIVFDVLRRYLTHLGYKVRFVRNITDVGHLTGDTDEGDDKISKQAKLEQIEPMEIVYRYTRQYHQFMDALNVLPPSIEPTATGHLMEQIRLVQQIIEAGYAYESNGSVYFDVQRYKEAHPYGELSGRETDELLENTRKLDGQSEKRNAADFALWKNAAPEHLMRWESPWGEGFPGWHLECTAMSTKYLGETFDIHGGGMDLMFPHHECEIAQAKAANHGTAPVRYWLHNNMITINGAKMSKSLGNFITIDQLFSGDSPLITQAFSPMTVRYFILGAQYRSPLDFTNEGLVAAQKGYKRLLNAWVLLRRLTSPNAPTQIDDKLDAELHKYCDTAWRGLNDDLNTAIVIAQLQNMVRKINDFYLNPTKLSTIHPDTFGRVRDTFFTMVEHILGLREEQPNSSIQLADALLALYADAKQRKDYDSVDKIRSYFRDNGLIVKDLKTGVEWAYEE